MVFLSLLCNTPMLETVVIDQPVLNNHLAVPHGWRLNSGSTVGCIIKVIKNVYIKCFSTFSLQSFKAHLADVLTVCVNKVRRYNKASILLLLLLPLSLLLLLLWLSLFLEVFFVDRRFLPILNLPKTIFFYPVFLWCIFVYFLCAYNQ